MSCLRHVYYVFGLENLNYPKVLVHIIAINCVQHRGCLKLPYEQKFLSCMAFEHVGKTTTSFTLHSFHHDSNSSCFLTALKRIRKKNIFINSSCTRFWHQKTAEINRIINFVRLTSLVLFVWLSSNYWFASRTDGPSSPNLCSISSIDLIIELTEKVFFDYVRFPNSSEL